MITTIDALRQWSLDREKGVREALKTFPASGCEDAEHRQRSAKIYSEIENAMLADPSDRHSFAGMLLDARRGDWVQRNKRQARSRSSVSTFRSTVQLVQAATSGDDRSARRNRALRPSTFS